MAWMAWPVVVLIIALVAIFAFKQPITRFLDRAHKISAPGVQASTHEQQINQQDTRSVEELLKAFDSPALRMREDAIRMDLDNRKITDSKAREQILIRHLASAFNSLDFENKYRAIWGSQLQVLGQLNSSTEPTSRELFKPVYEQAAGLNPEVFKNYSFDQWLDFLRQILLIVEKDGTLQISIEGREFLISR
jgi:hypothetical protein